MLFLLIGCLVITQEEYDQKMVELSPLSEQNETGEEIVFYLAANNKTIFCPDATLGSTGIIDDIIYTKRDRNGLDELIDLEAWTDLETSCTSGVTNMSELLSGSSFNGDLSSWDVSNVTNMDSMFREATLFNGDISNWDTSNVTNMHAMFVEAELFNSDISAWNVSNVTNMNGTFAACPFNGDISNWDVSNVTNMEAMFGFATAFEGDLSSWNTSNVTNMQEMFAYTEVFNSDISSWDVSTVDNMEGLFRSATAFNQDLSDWCVEQIASVPDNFDNGATSWTEPQPVWGTCP